MTSRPLQIVPCSLVAPLEETEEPQSESHADRQQEYSCLSNQDMQITYNDKGVVDIICKGEHQVKEYFMTVSTSMESFFEVVSIVMFRS